MIQGFWVLRLEIHLGPQHWRYCCKQAVGFPREPVGDYFKFFSLVFLVNNLNAVHMIQGPYNETDLRPPKFSSFSQLMGSSSISDRVVLIDGYEVFQHQSLQCFYMSFFLSKKN